MGLGSEAKTFAQANFAQCDPRRIRPDAVLWDFTSHLYSGRGTVGELIAFALSEISYFFALAASAERCTLVVMIDDPNHVPDLKVEERARRRAGAPPQAQIVTMEAGTILPDGWQRVDANRRLFASCLERALEAYAVVDGGCLVSHCSSRAFEVTSGSVVRELEAPAVGEADVAAVHWAHWLARERVGTRTVCLRTIDTDSLAIGLLLQSQISLQVYLWLAARGASVVMGSAVSVEEGVSGIYDFAATIQRIDARRFAMAAALFGCDFLKKSEWAKPRAVGAARATELFKEWVATGAAPPPEALPGAGRAFEKANRVADYWLSIRRA